MALVKEIVLENGVTVNYHRVASVNNITNQMSIIELSSYTNKSKREEEKLKLASKQPMNVFVKTEYLSVPYNENLNVVNAYEHLKTLEKFNGCVND